MLVAAPAAGVHVLKPYQVQRLTAFLHPSLEPAETRLPAAGVEDRDRLRAEDRSRRQGAARRPNGFVPESHTDFIFAAVGEQYGFVGAALVLLLYGC